MIEARLIGGNKHGDIVMWDGLSVFLAFPILTPLTTPLELNELPQPIEHMIETYKLHSVTSEGAKFIIME